MLMLDAPKLHTESVSSEHIKVGNYSHTLQSPQGTLHKDSYMKSKSGRRRMSSIFLGAGVAYIFFYPSVTTCLARLEALLEVGRLDTHFIACISELNSVQGILLCCLADLQL